MRKIIFLGILSPLAFYSQVLNHQTAIAGKAERHLQFKVTDAPNDVLEIVNHTSTNGQFAPAIWAHRESGNGNALALSAHITSAVDNGTTPIINIVAAKGIFDNNAPYASQFPWGDGGSGLPILNRPLLSVSNAYTAQLLLAANGNLGIGTTNPLSTLHTVGSVRFQSLPTITSGCNLMINPTTGQIGLSEFTFCNNTSLKDNVNKTPIINALKTVTNIDTYEFVDQENKVNTFTNSEKTKINDGDYNNLIPYLLESIKELNAKIENLESQINSKNNFPTSSNHLAVKIYPNPVKDIFNIYFDKTDTTNYSVKIYDNTGKLLINKTETPSNQKMSLNVSNFSSGLYVYEVLNNKGEIKKGKFIKE